MSQTKGTTTNMTKLVAWDIDEYLGFSDDECLVCLTQKELYVLRNVLRQVEWSTRWTSEVGTPQPDRTDIAERLAYKMSGTNCIDFCQSIIDCINDPQSGVADAIFSSVNINNQSESIAYGQSQQSLALGIGNNPLCDPDKWYGGTLNLVQSLNRNNVDGLEIFEVVTNQFDLFGQVAGNITGLDESNIDAVLAWITFVQENIKENYEAQYTQEYEEVVSCQLRCIAMENCELTPQQIFDYFDGRLSAGLTFGGLLKDSLLFLATGTWSGTQIVDAMMLSQIVFRAQLGIWFEYVAFNSIDVDIRLGLNDPNPDWTIICDPCNPVDNCLSYLASQQNNTSLGTSLMSFTNIGMRGSKGVAGAYRWSFVLNSPPTSEFDTIEITWDASGASWNNTITSSTLRYTYEDNTFDEYNVDFTPPFGQPLGETTNYTVTPPDNQKVLSSIRFFWETTGAGGNNGLYYTREICFEQS